jgi:hypothetical protein
MCTLGYSLHEINGTSDTIIGVKHTSFALLGGITGTNPVSSHALICANLIANCVVIFVHLSDIYVQFLHLHIFHILNLLEITSVAIFIHCLIIRTNKFVTVNGQSLKHLSVQPQCALTYNQSHSVTQL